MNRFQTSLQLNVSRLALIIGLTLVLLGYGIFYFRLSNQVSPSWDSAAYMYAGQQLTDGNPIAYCNKLNQSVGYYFTLSGFNIQQKGRPDCLYLNYPPGFPLLIALVQKINGSHTIFFVSAIMALLTLVATFIIGRILYSSVTGLLSIIILGSIPTFLYFSTDMWSDIPATALLCVSIASFLLAQKQSTMAKKVILSGVAASILSFTGFIRYASIIYFLPLALWVLWTEGRTSFGSAQNWTFVIVGSIGVILLLMWNKFYFGGYFQTAYSPIHGWYQWDPFSWRYLLGKSPVGGQSLLVAIKTIVIEWQGWLIFAMYGLAVTKFKRHGLPLSIISITILFYGLYAFSSEGINRRFLLPAFPFIALVVANGLEQAYRLLQKKIQVIYQNSIVSTGAFSISLAVVILTLLWTQGQILQARNISQLQQVTTVSQLAAKTPEDAVILAYNLNDPLILYGHRTTFYYRRLPSANFETTLVQSVQSLLDSTKPVFYIDDSSWSIRDKLESHFSLIPVQQGSSLFRVTYSIQEKPDNIQQEFR